MRGIEVRERLGQIRINVQAVGDAELEVWAAHKQAKALEDALDREVRIKKVPYRKASAPSVALVNNAVAVNAEPKRDRRPRRRRTD